MKIEKLSPAFKDYLWGGVKLREEYGKACEFEKIAESWELSIHPDGESRIEGGEYDSLTLSRYLEKSGKDVLGKRCAKFESLPILIKFIDAKQALSIQVHPGDEYAMRVEGEMGKTEMWVVVDCEPDAFLYFGVNQNMTKDEFKHRIENNTLLDMLKKVPVKPGDVFFIDAGTIHAIGAGILICEIQQNSNTTYRVYDFARRDAQGHLRELHVDKAVEVSVLTTQEASNTNKTGRLASCDYFTVDRYEGDTHFNVTQESFACVTVLKGNGMICGDENCFEIRAGESFFIPAGSGEIKVSGKCEFLKTTI